MVWLTSVAITLLASGHDLAVAVRDLTMVVSAWSLARLSALDPEV